MNLNQIKEKYGYPLDEYFLNTAVDREDYHWLIEQAKQLEFLKSVVNLCNSENMTPKDVAKLLNKS